MVRALCSQVCSFFASETEKEHPEELRDETPFLNAKSVRRRSVTKEVCTGYLAMFPGTSLLLAELKRDTPRNFDMKRLIRNAFYERPILCNRAED